MSDNLKIPQHVAIIMDGNGRWAKKKGMPRTYGHVQGAKKIEVVTRAAKALGIKYVTVYAFSTENWSRSEEEVTALMKLFRSYLKNSVKSAHENKMRIRIIGEKSRLDKDLQDIISYVEGVSEQYDEITLTLAINYGGRDELTRAVKKIAGKVANGELGADDISEDTIREHLDAPDIPDPDLMIRTCGEERISNFLMWELAYSELYFTPVAWPDFDGEELRKAVEAYTSRDRRFGGVKEDKE